MGNYDREIFIGAVLVVFAIFALWALSSSVPQSIIPNAGIGGLPIYAPGETVYWRVALHPQDGVPLFTSLGCANAASYTPVGVIAQTTLICDGNTIYTQGSTLTAPSSSCNVFLGTNAPIDFPGEASATIPATATSCYIYNLFTAHMNSAPNVLKQQQDTTNTGTLVLQALPACTNGQVMCVGSQPKACINGQWQQREICANGCSGGYCTRVCTTGATQCYGSQNQICNVLGEWIFDYSSTSCATPVPTTKPCPDGSVIPAAQNCPTVPALYCGDGICNNGETNVTCLRDCPIAPLPPAPTPSNNTTVACPTSMPICASGYVHDADGCVTGCAQATIPQQAAKNWIEENWLLVIVVMSMAMILALISYYALLKGD